MSYTSKSTFLRKGTKPSSSPKIECPICYKPYPPPTSLHNLSQRIRNIRTAAKLLFSHTRHLDSDATFIPKPHARSKLRCRNHITEIKKCGHTFCMACLKKWLENRDTCPMCRTALFFDAEKAYQEYEARLNQGYLEIRDMDAPSTALSMASSDIGVVREQRGAGTGGDNVAQPRDALEDFIVALDGSSRRSVDNDVESIRRERGGGISTIGSGMEVIRREDVSEDGR